MGSTSAGRTRTDGIAAAGAPGAQCDSRRASELEPGDFVFLEECEGRRAAIVRTVGAAECDGAGLVVTLWSTAGRVERSCSADDLFEVI